MQMNASSAKHWKYREDFKGHNGWKRRLDKFSLEIGDNFLAVKGN